MSEGGEEGFEPAQELYIIDGLLSLGSCVRTTPVMLDLFFRTWRFLCVCVFVSCAAVDAFNDPVFRVSFALRHVSRCVFPATRPK